jgi:hypothetical protein
MDASLSTPKPLAMTEPDLEQGPAGDESAFYKTDCNGMCGVIENSFKTRQLKPLDCLILTVIAANLNYRTGRCKLSVKEIAEKIGYDYCRVQPAVKRLLDAAILARVEPRDGFGFYIHPQIISIGSRKIRGHVWKLFKAYHGFTEE